MRIALFGTRRYDRDHFDAANADRQHEIAYLEPRLSPETALLATDFPCVCAFVNDDLGAATLERLAGGGTRLVALRCAGFNNVDLDAARRLGLTVARVPAYAPEGVAEFAVALLLTLNRKTHKAAARVREGNFALDGLVGFNLFGKTVGVVGTGKIGHCFARIARGFGCRVLAFDKYPNDETRALGAEYVALDELLAGSDVVSLHCPLTPETRHLIHAEALSRMKPGATLINTGRGALIDTRAVIAALKDKRLGGLAIDVYEEEEGVFFEDRSAEGVTDDVLARLLTFPNVLVTGHQAFLTAEALDAIARVTLGNVGRFERGEECGNRV